MKNVITLKSFLFATGLLLILVSCECYEDPGIMTSETRELAEFDALKIESVGKVNIYSAEEYAIRIRTHENITEDIITSVVDDELTIRLTGNYRRINTLEFDVFVPYLQRIEQNDVAKISCLDGFTSETLTIIQNDVGDITIHNLIVQQLDVRLNDVGDVKLSGMAEDINAKLDGVGDLHLFELHSKNAVITLDGTGDIEVSASEFLDIDLSGIGSVYYKGSPTIKINNTGIGMVVNVN